MADMTKSQLVMANFRLRQDLAAARAELAELRKRRAERRGLLGRIARAVWGCGGAK